MAYVVILAWPVRWNECDFIVATRENTLATTAHTRLAHTALRVLLSSALVAAGVYGVIVATFSVGLVSPKGSDFGVYFNAAEALRYNSRANIYAWQTLVAVTQAHGGCVGFDQTAFTYPPLFAILLEPLTLLPCAYATYLWHALNVVLWGGSMVLLVERLRQRWPHQRLLATTLMVCASVFFWHLLFGFWLGQVHLLVLFGILLAPWLDEHGHPFAAGVVLAFITLVKIFPVLLILYYLARGHWRVVFGATLGALAFTVVMIAVVGPWEVIDSIPSMMSTVHGLSSVWLNESLSNQIPVAGALLADMVGVVSACGIWLLRRRGDERLGYAWTLCAMLLVSPLVWSFFLVWLLPVFAACLGAVQSRQWRFLVALTGLFAVIALQTPMVLRPVATLVLWMVTGVLFVRSANIALIPWLTVPRQRPRIASPGA